MLFAAPVTESRHYLGVSCISCVAEGECRRHRNLNAPTSTALVTVQQCFYEQDSLRDVDFLHNGQVCGGYGLVCVYLTASSRLRYFASHVRSCTTMYTVHEETSQPHGLSSDTCIALWQTETKQSSDSHPQSRQKPTEVRPPHPNGRLFCGPVGTVKPSGFGIWPVSYAGKGPSHQ
jgi:hypothetical protein